MKHNKILLNIAFVGFGLLGGWLLFGNASSTPSVHDHQETEQATQLWTCSMHPQIMQPEAGDCPICGMDLIPAESGAEGLAADQFKLTANAMALADVQTSVVGDMERDEPQMKLSGKITQNEASNSVQVGHIAGRIERLNVSITGEKVQKGQLLATIYSPELYAAQQELITASALQESQPALYNAVRNKLTLWKLSEKQLNQIETTGKIVENFPVYATVSGTVSEKLVEQGEYIKQGQPLLKIANLSSVWANFDLYEHQLGLVEKGQEIAITTNAYPSEKFNVKVDFIDPVLNTATRTVRVRAVLNNAANLFKPGMFVTGILTKTSAKSDRLLTIPASAVLWTGERSVVYVKTKPTESIFEMREIHLGNRQGEYYEVRAGLENGEEIVTSGTFTVDAAAQLNGKKSMMNSSGKPSMTGHEGHTSMREEMSNSNSTSLREGIKYVGSTLFNKQFETVIAAYMDLKNTLVKDNAKAAKSSSEVLLKSIKKVALNELPNSAGRDLWKLLDSKLSTSVKALSKEEDLAGQRVHFHHVSTHLTELLKSFKVEKTVYHLYCPMADNNNGGYWLSMESTVENPYFGSSMLNCGSVHETFAL